MKKFFLTLMIAMYVFVSSAATTAKVAVDSASKTSVSVADTATLNYGKKQLQNLVVGTKELATNGYDIVVQQQRMYAFQYLIVGILCVVSLFFFVYFYRKSTGEQKVGNNLVPAILCLIVSIWSGIVFSLHYGQVIQGFINPDYAAIKDIISMFKK